LIIDTDVLIWHLRGNEKAKEIIHKNIPFNISVVTYIELIKGMRDKKELNNLTKQFAQWNVNIIQINNDISTRAMIYIEQYCHSNAMEMADALIAATCINNSEILLTGNEKHFKHIPNIQVKKFTAI
jgi:predicted nucleic acid-binding protein